MIKGLEYDDRLAPSNHSSRSSRPSAAAEGSSGRATRESAAAWATEGHATHDGENGPRKMLERFRRRFRMANGRTEGGEAPLWIGEGEFQLFARRVADDGFTTNS